MIYCFSMPLPDATQLPEYLGSERSRRSKKSSRKKRESKTVRKCSVHQSKVRMLWKQMAVGQLWHCSMQIRKTPWHLSDTICSARKLRALRTFVTPERLPPTTSACKFHSLWTYYQVIVRMGHSDEMEPSEWGWKVEGGKLVRVMTDKSPAPDVLIKMIHCNTLKCRKHGLECTSACGQCQDGNCDTMTNEPVIEEDDEQDCI